MADAAGGHASDGTLLEIEVVWIGAAPPLRVTLRVAPGVTVAQALAASRIAAHIGACGTASDPLADCAIAVHGRHVRPDDPLHDHDRIELLPPLTVDPKVARQRRAEHRRRLSGERRWAPDRERPVGAMGTARMTTDGVTTDGVTTDGEADD